MLYWQLLQGRKSSFKKLAHLAGPIKSSGAYMHPDFQPQKFLWICVTFKLPKYEKCPNFKENAKKLTQQIDKVITKYLNNIRSDSKVSAK